MNRRRLLQTAMGVVAFPYIARPAVRGANDRLQIGFIGVGGRAKWLMKNELFVGADITAVADCWQQRLDEAVTLRPEGSKWAKFDDYRQMLDSTKLDAVFVETPTHSRALICIQAMQAGLDVYAEKPVSLTIEEGQVLVRAARRYKRIVQAGTQQRSMPINMYASKLVRDGKIGKVKEVIVCNFLAPRVWQELPGETMPAGLNWEQWVNQTEMRPYHSKMHRGWMPWRDYDGGGQSWGVSGWGTHSLDQVQTALGTDLTGPVEIILEPKKPGTAMPDVPVTLRYANGTLVKLEQEKINDHQQLGGIFAGNGGKLQIIRGDFLPEDPALKKDAPPMLPEGPGENAAHIADFFECVRSRRRPNADVEIAHRSTSVCQLINIARELNRSLKWDPKAERFPNDAEANVLRARTRRKGFELPKIG